ncbi:hypothetical protein TWF696_006301 [Orbilia brochopaga]|uniref:Uncharacterized protein n=1 Tax=Orbilia brochopaga TaxID=3140254 RepID=A0AAV9UVZ4_9PEZI
MSLCSRAILQVGRRPATVSRPAYIYAKRQLATEVESSSKSFSEPPPPPPTAADTTNAASLDAPSSDVSSSDLPRAAPAASRKPKSKYSDGDLHTIETMPYTCYQAALKILREDRLEKLKRIEAEQASIEALKTHHGYTDDDRRIKGMQKYIDEMQLNIDKNNPRIKYNYDNKLKRDPHRRIYQYWDDLAWRAMRRKILMQRLTQMYVVPDLLPTINPIVDVRMRFRRRNAGLGAKMLARNVLHHPSVRVIPFDSKKRLVTILVVDADRPNLVKNGFDFYLQWMVTNCPVDIENPIAIGRSAVHAGRDEVVPYEVPYVHKGENYHRYCVFVLEQEDRLEIGKKIQKGAKEAEAKSGKEVEVKEVEVKEVEVKATEVKEVELKESEVKEVEVKQGEAVESEVKTDVENDIKASKPKDASKREKPRIERLGFNLRSFIAKNNLTVIGAHLWRCEFDESMMEVMKKLGRKDWNMKYVKHPEHI